MRPRLILRGALAATLAAVVLSTVQSSEAADDEPEWYPGLPDTTFGEWSNAAQVGQSYAKRAKQWFRSPSGMVVTEFAVGSDPGDRPGDGWARVGAILVSPEGAPANYGYSAPMTVRSVGFGLVPVEATVQISQRFADGYPVAFRTEMRNYWVAPARPGASYGQRYASAVIKDSVNVRILAVRIDGLDIGLSGDCRTVEPAPFTMRTPEYVIPDASKKEEYYRTHDPATYWNPLKGGQFSGTLTIPPFTGCTTTAGDDLSDLMTLSASGPDNPIAARNGWPCGYQVNNVSSPMPPGASTPKLATKIGALSQYADGCAGAKPFDLPERDDR